MFHIVFYNNVAFRLCSRNLSSKIVADNDALYSFLIKFIIISINTNCR